MRVRSLSPRPAGIASPGAAVWPRLGLLLTPARWGAKRCAAHGRAHCGSGGTVPDGTGWNRTRNRQHTQIIGQFARFQQFRGGASRDACVGVCAGTRAHMRGVGVGTVELEFYIVRYQWVSGSIGGSKRFHAGTGGGWSVAGAANGHFLAGGYPARVADRLPSGPWGAGAAQSFGCFGRGLAGRGELVEQGRNGGILPICRARSGRVGRVALEGWAQAYEIAGQSGLCRQPVRLRRTTWARPIAGPTPPLPPFAEASAPSSLTLDLGRILDRHRGERLLLALSEQAEPRQVWCGGIGSGWGSLGSLARRADGRVAGRGETRSVPRRARDERKMAFRGKLRRSGQASAGVAGVN